MSDTCGRFDQWLKEGGSGAPNSKWSEHFEACTECHEQWQTHRLLVASVAEETVPDLTSEFDARLERRLAAEVEVRPLRGWRRAAMLAYVTVALAVLAWVFRNVTLPPIDAAAPWLAVGTFIAMPLTFALAIAVSRWMPGARLQL